MKQLTMKQKLADWASASYSTGDLQDEVLKGLIVDLRVKIGVMTPGVA